MEGMPPKGVCEEGSEVSGCEPQTAGRSEEEGAARASGWSMWPG